MNNSLKRWGIRNSYLIDQKESSLEHVGILGMHWGVRRGESNSGNKSSGHRTKVPQSEHHLEVAQIKKKRVSQMSNEELKKVVTRMQLVKQYKELNPGKIRKGKVTVDNVMSFVGKASATAGILYSAYKFGKPIVTAMLAKAAAASTAAKVAESFI